jgi:hypothetical protein
MEIEAGLSVPPGGLVLKPPVASRRAIVNGHPLTPGTQGEMVVKQLPARIVWKD